MVVEGSVFLETLIVRASISPEKAQRMYDRLSWIYDCITAFETVTVKKALSVAEVREGYTVLDVGFGTGRVLVELAKRVGRTGRVCGVDISPKMCQKAKEKVKKSGFYERVDLKVGDARKLPCADNAFDLVFSSYMLDLIDTPEIPHVLSEFKRVLKPGGKLVLVNMSKNKQGRTFYELLYSLGLGVGGCRPILAKPFLEKLGFQNVGRLYVDHLLYGSEIVWGNKPRTRPL